MTEKWAELNEELRKIPRGADGAPQFLRHLMKMFVADFETSMSKRLDVKFWNKLKFLMDEMKRASESDRIVNLNVQNLAFGFLTDLMFLVTSNYEIPNSDVPFLDFPRGSSSDRKSVNSKKNSRVFLGFMMLRIGDLWRYKENYPMARQFYEKSRELNPADGAVWNQLGILAALSAQNVDCVYFHTRALHATIDFPAASGSLNSIFKKFANRDISKSMPINEKYLACLARIHFLLEIEDPEKNLREIGEIAATKKEWILPILSIYRNLEGDTEIENRAITYVRHIWSHAQQRLLDEISKNPKNPELLHILAFLHNAPELLNVAESSEVLRKIRESMDDVIRDSEGFSHFHGPRKVQYPLRRDALIEFVAGKLEEELTSSESGDSDSEAEIDEDDDVENQNQKDAVSSDEEILIRGRRRGAVELVDSDDEEF